MFNLLNNNLKIERLKMKFLKFKIQGDFATFKRGTTVNDTTELVLSYDYMPLTALKGFIGAILGYEGLAQATKTGKIEYMDKLSNAKIAVIPNRPTKFKQRITNTTGFGNNGATMILEQQVLDGIDYTVYISNFDDYDKFKDMMFKNKTTYPLTLGRKGFTASYSEVEEVDVEFHESSYLAGKVKGFMNPQALHSILDDEDYSTVRLPFLYKNMLYEFENYVLTNEEVTYLGDLIIYGDDAISIFWINLRGFRTM